jgi:hypothetical protein
MKPWSDRDPCPDSRWSKRLEWVLTPKRWGRVELVVCMLFGCVVRQVRCTLRLLRTGHRPVGKCLYTSLCWGWGCKRLVRDANFRTSGFWWGERATREVLEKWCGCTADDRLPPEASHVQTGTPQTIINRNHILLTQRHCIYLEE